MVLLYSSSNFGGVTDVTLVKNGSNTVVKVTKTSGSAARAAFELHYFIPAPKFSTIQWAWGPFVSLNSKPLTDLAASSLSSVGGGLMIGANAYVDDSGGKSVSHSVNLGIGWMVDTGVKELAPGVVNGQTLWDKTSCCAPREERLHGHSIVQFLPQLKGRMGRMLPPGILH
jgi:hypothetical protein